jgi:hypothetical protein
VKKTILLLLAATVVAASVLALEDRALRGHVTAALGAAFHPTRAVVVPAGTALALRLEDRLSTDESHSGDAFRATVADPVTLDGAVVIPSGAEVSGHVLDVEPAGHISGHGRLQLAFDDLAVGAQHFRLETHSVMYQSGSHARRSAEFIGGGAAIGGLIGGLTGRSGGSAAGGALLGGAAGTAASLSGQRPGLAFPPGTLIHVRLDRDLPLRVPRV